MFVMATILSCTSCLPRLSSSKVGVKRAGALATAWLHVVLPPDRHSTRPGCCLVPDVDGSAQTD